MDRNWSRWFQKNILEFDMKYVEFPPRHYTYNQHSAIRPITLWKEIFSKNFYDRNKQIVEYSDYVVSKTLPERQLYKGNLTYNRSTKKLNKKVIILH